MNAWILCCLILSGANQVPQRAPPVPEFPPDIILQVEKDASLFRVPKGPVPDWNDPDSEDFPNPFFPAPSPFNLHGTDDEEQ
jgi:hypothetical protein